MQDSATATAEESFNRIPNSTRLRTAVARCTAFAYGDCGQGLVVQAERTNSTIPVPEGPTGMTGGARRAAALVGTAGRGHFTAASTRSPMTASGATCSSVRPYR